MCCDQMGSCRAGLCDRCGPDFGRYVVIGDLNLPKEDKNMIPVKVKKNYCNYVLLYFSYFFRNYRCSGDYPQGKRTVQPCLAGKSESEGKLQRDYFGLYCRKASGPYAAV